MNKRISELVAEISYLITLINLDSRDHVAFIRISGHVGSIEIEYYENGWKSRDNATLRDAFYLDGICVNDELLIKRLNKILNTLRKIYKYGKIDYKNFDYDIQEIKSYKFF